MGFTEYWVACAICIARQCVAPSGTGAWLCEQVDETFEVRGVGSVVAGTVVAGRVVVGSRLLLGPSPSGRFATVVVSCIHRSQVQPFSSSINCRQTS